TGFGYSSTPERIAPLEGRSLECGGTTPLLTASHDSPHQPSATGSFTCSGSCRRRGLARILAAKARGAAQSHIRLKGSQSRPNSGMANQQQPSLHVRELGRSGLRVSEIGLGCMGMSEFYQPGQMNDAESIAVIHRYLDGGGNFLDTADMYGVGRNEDLVGRAIAGRRDRVVLATKFGNVRGPGGEFLGIRGDPEYVRASCDASLRRLKVDVIDLYYQHRVDPKVPIEETVGAMAELVRAGKVRHLGLSEAGPATIRRAAAVHPIAALQTEYSLWSREPERELFATIRELGIGFVAYSPLGRGFLTGQFRSIDDFPADDYRRHSPRFQGENFQKNLDLVTKVQDIARRKGCTASQLALAWVLAQGNDIVPIPGTKRTRYLEENLAAAQIHLTPEELKEIDTILPAGSASGERYAPSAMAAIDRG